MRMGLILVFYAINCITCAEAQPSKLIRIYSDLCIDKEEGDLVGHRLLILSMGAPYAIYQIGAGDTLTAPELAPISFERDKFSFSIHTQDISGNFTGMIAPSSVNGKFSSSSGITLQMRLLLQHDGDAVPLCQAGKGSPTKN